MFKMLSPISYIFLVSMTDAYPVLSLASTLLLLDTMVLKLCCFCVLLPITIKLRPKNEAMQKPKIKSVYKGPEEVATRIIVEVTSTYQAIHMALCL